MRSRHVQTHATHDRLTCSQAMHTTNPSDDRQTADRRRWMWTLISKGCCLDDSISCAFRRTCPLCMYACSSVRMRVKILYYAWRVSVYVCVCQYIMCVCVSCKLLQRTRPTVVMSSGASRRTVTQHKRQTKPRRPSQNKPNTHRTELAHQHTHISHTHTWKTRTTRDNKGRTLNSVSTRLMRRRKEAVKVQAPFFSLPGFIFGHNLCYGRPLIIPNAKINMCISDRNSDLRTIQPEFC